MEARINFWVDRGVLSVDDSWAGLMSMDDRSETEMTLAVWCPEFMSVHPALLMPPPSSLSHPINVHPFLHVPIFAVDLFCMILAQIDT